MGAFCLFLFVFALFSLLTLPHQCLSGKKKWGKWRLHFELVHTVGEKINKWDSLEEHLVLCWVFYLMEASFLLLTSQLYISWQNTEKKKRKEIFVLFVLALSYLSNNDHSQLSRGWRTIFSHLKYCLWEIARWIWKRGFEMRTESSLNQLYVSVLFHHFSGLQTSYLLNKDNVYLTVAVIRRVNWIFILPQMVVSFLIRKFYSWLSWDFIF